MVLYARSSLHSMFMQPKTINDKNFDAKHKTFSDTDNAYRDWNRYPYAFHFSSYRYTFSMFIEGLWQGKICTHADDGGCCARLMYVSLGKCVEIREMSPKHVHHAVKPGIEYILSHET